MPIDLVTGEDIDSISSDFWSSMVDVHLRRVESPSAPEEKEQSIVGHVDIQGAWSGMIEVKASRGLAEATASSMLNKRAADVTAEECSDAVQEATNIIAGSIKRLLPSVCLMGLPAMSSSGGDAGMQQCSEILEVYFVSPCGQLAIAVGSQEQSS
jgi:CheY-specific phosphatase CheX